MDKLLDRIVDEEGFFTSKADLARFAMVDYLHGLDMLPPQAKSGEGK